jgi:hypothetical protein
MGLIDRLKDRMKAEPSVDMHDLAPEIRPQPPVSAAKVAEAEERLGFELPPLVRDLYTQVADGGYGPGYGLVSLAEMVQRGQEFEEQRALFPWPAKAVHLCWWGCDYLSVLDCSGLTGPVLRYVPDDCTAEPLVPEAESLEKWLEAWLRGERLWNRA